MKKLVLAIAMASGIGLLGAQQASADTFKFNFCGFATQSTTCTDGHTGITDWSIAFTTVDGTADINDYTAVVSLTATASAANNAIFMDSFDWTAGKNFEATPTLTGVTGDGTALPAAYAVSIGKVNSGGSDGCSTAGNATNVCTELTGAGNAPNISGTQTWTFAVDFIDADGAITAQTGVNLRALFDGTAAAGGTKVSGIISPGGVAQQTTTNTPTTEDVVPEPALLSLLGVGLAPMAIRRRPAA